MRRFSSPLANVLVAAPCPADWDGMIGGDRVRFCSQCELNVYNLSAMSKFEAESLIARTEGRLCVRFYRRKDGSILTDNCPVGLRALKRRALRIKTAVASSLLGFLAGIGSNGAVNRVGSYFLNQTGPPPFHRATLGMVAGPMAQEPGAETGKFVPIRSPISKPRKSK
jgi:hypothetical protein